ncbi:GNAT family N-acetyltransferase [Paenibacillus thailandensis]|uniref:GNAT family N-acetyltransferase n=1 Tax=Paenibacillus thailandensis TaxID=393250 RepID=A0ABW5QUM5_9BACL
MGRRSREKNRLSSFRSQGIGTQIHLAIEKWSKEKEVEFLILWPSADSIKFYSRNGFFPSKEAMEKHWK